MRELALDVIAVTDGRLELREEVCDRHGGGRGAEGMAAAHILTRRWHGRCRKGADFSRAVVRESSLV